VGDIHGRLDLLEPLLKQIRADAASFSGDGKPLIVFLGDYIDRGTASKGVIDALLALKLDDGFDLAFLKGNHEEALVTFLDDPKIGPSWYKHGGGQTLVSYGVNPPALMLDDSQWEVTQEAFAKALTRDHLDFYQNLELTVTVGDYLFVHAGVRPGVALEAQDEKDLLWIRDDFIRSRRPSADKVVVHGHTPEEGPYLGEHRIGVDTGAYATGVLTAVRIEGDELTVFQASGAHSAMGR
jgi:serine/threonine protein phosphatase 1